MSTSWSEMQKFLRCPRAWELSYHDKLEPKKENPNLLRGRAFHKAIETHLLNRDVSVEVRKVSTEFHDEVLFIYNHHKSHIPESAEVARAKDLFPDTYNKYGFLPYEPMVEVNFDDTVFTGIVDAVVFDHDLDAFVIVDWKLRNSMSHPMDIQVDGQLQFYAAVLNKMGANIEYAYMWEFRAKVPKLARINKNGMPSVAAQDTTWKVWWQSLPPPLRESLDEKAWQLTMTGQLRGEEEYAKRHLIPITHQSTNLALNNAYETVNRIMEAEERLKAGVAPPAVLSSYGCRFCEYVRLCASPLQYGDDPTEMIEEYYQKKGA